jgi:hypothetical protein
MIGWCGGREEIYRGWTRMGERINADRIGDGGFGRWGRIVWAGISLGQEGGVSEGSLRQAEGRQVERARPGRRFARTGSSGRMGGSGRTGPVGPGGHIGPPLRKTGRTDGWVRLCGPGGTGRTHRSAPTKTSISGREDRTGGGCTSGSFAALRMTGVGARRMFGARRQDAQVTGASVVVLVGEVFP